MWLSSELFHCKWEHREPSLRNSGNIRRAISLKPGLEMQGLRSGLNREQNDCQPKSFSLMMHNLSFASGSFCLSLKSGFLCISHQPPW